MSRSPLAPGPALALLLLAGGCASTDYVTGQRTLNRFSIEDDVDLGTRYATLMLAAHEAAGARVDVDDVYSRSVRAVAARLLAVPENRARMPPYPWEVHAIDDAQQNAWCFPGGQVLVFAGLMRSGIVRDEDELAAILGHEMAHAAARHATERKTAAELRSVLEPLGRFLGPRIVDLARERAPAELVGGLVASQDAYDQGQEIEADVIGLEMMARAGYDPEAAARIWARIERDKTVIPGADPGGTHPTYALRMRELARHVPAARELVRRRVSEVPSWIEATGWRWVASSTTATASVAEGRRGPAGRLPAEGPLPTGPGVDPTWLRPPSALLDLGMDLSTGSWGETLAVLRVRAARDLVLDGLPHDVSFEVHRKIGDEWIRFWRSKVADRAPFVADERVLKWRLPFLLPGQYRIKATVEVGSLRATSLRRVDVVLSL